MEKMNNCKRLQDNSPVHTAVWQVALKVMVKPWSSIILKGQTPHEHNIKYN